MSYYKLLDPRHKNAVVRTEGRSQQQFIPGRGWVESGIMMRYFSDESELYGSYEEVSEEEALKITASK